MGVYENAYPIMEGMGIKGIVFIVVDYIGRRNLWDAHFLTPYIIWIRGRFWSYQGKVG